MRCYMQAQRHDPENFNVIRDLSYLQLYLRQYHSFLDTARRGMEMRSNQMINWATYAFANYLVHDYDFAFRLMESCHKIGGPNIKNTERHEILQFQALMLIKQNKNEEALKFVLDNEKLMSYDKTLVNEKVISLAIKLNKKDVALDYINRAFKSNSEKAEYFVDFLNATHNLNIKSFEELLKYSITNKESAEILLKTISEDLKPRIRSRIINRIELALSQGQKFKEIFCLYLLQNIKQNLPSVFINVKFLYRFQPDKISIMEEVILAHISSIQSSGKLDSSLLANNETLDITPDIIWVYYYAAQHFEFVRDLEKALLYINKAIDLTPSVVEFYMVKSKILAHGGMLENSAKAYEKAKKLDLGDRYLNAKHAKVVTRIGDVKRSSEIMKEFVKDPLGDDNAEHFQCMWYETECGYAYLRSKNILRAHRLFKLIFTHFNTLIEDQFDFYNYCLRRFMVNDFARTIEYMDKILDNKYVYQSLEAFDIILNYLKTNSTKENEKSLMSEYEEMQKEKLEKYKFKDVSSLIVEIENDVYNFCMKLQAYSKIHHLHHVSVKTFLQKGKIILALKSLVFLKKHAEGSYEYLDSLDIFSKYLSQNKEKISTTFIDIIYEKFEILKSEEEVKKYLNEERSKLRKIVLTNGNITESILTNAYESIINNTQTIEKSLDKLLDCSQSCLRKTKSLVN